jgi:periplasmic protein CpxP/Spy
MESRQATSQEEFMNTLCAKSLRAKPLIAALSLILLAGAAIAQTTAPAAAPPAHEFRGRGFGGPMFGMFFHQLNLSDAQKTQMKQIMTQEKPTLKPLMQQMAQGENQLRTLELSGSFDEAQARTIASQQSQNATELMVQRARVESELIQLLTPDQKTKLAQLVQQHAQRFSSQGQNPDSATANQ